MKTFNKPINLNGAELMSELAEAGILVNEITDFANGKIGFKTDDEKTAENIVANHNGNIIPSEPSVLDKLASVGISVDDLKNVLGLK